MTGWEACTCTDTHDCGHTRNGDTHDTRDAKEQQ